MKSVWKKKLYGEGILHQRDRGEGVIYQRDTAYNSTMKRKLTERESSNHR